MRVFEALWNQIAYQSPFPIPVGMGLRLAAYRDELVRWNLRINLARFADDRELAVRHFLDSLAGLRFLPEGALVGDIGSGAGFPGLVVALARPDLRVTCVESIEKKANFLRHIRRALEIDNAEIIGKRAENLPAGAFNVVLGRAVAKPEAFAALARPLTRSGGRILVWLSAEDESKFADSAVIEVSRYVLPDETKERCVALIGASE